MNQYEIEARAEMHNHEFALDLSPEVRIERARSAEEVEMIADELIDAHMEIPGEPEHFTLVLQAIRGEDLDAELVGLLEAAAQKLRSFVPPADVPSRVEQEVRELING